jgi:hypothetical protein
MGWRERWLARDSLDAGAGRTTGRPRGGNAGRTGRTGIRARFFVKGRSMKHDISDPITIASVVVRDHLQQTEDENDAR